MEKDGDITIMNGILYNGYVIPIQRGDDTKYHVDFSHEYWEWIEQPQLRSGNIYKIVVVKDSYSLLQICQIKIV